MYVERIAALDGDAALVDDAVPDVVGIQHLGERPGLHERECAAECQHRAGASGIVGNKIAATTFALSTLGYGVGIGFLGLSVVAAIPIGLWKMKKSNKELRDYLDDLCSDLLIISEHFIIAIINPTIFLI